MEPFFVATVDDGGGPASAIVSDGQAFLFPGRPSVADLLADWDEQESHFADRLASGSLEDPVPLASVRLLTPVPAPPTLYMVGANYASHTREMQKLPPDAPVPRFDEGPYIFFKPASTLVDPGAPIVLPEGYAKVDWEVELAAVIGRRAHKVSAADALDYVAGYTVANDVSVRDAFHRTCGDREPPMEWDWFGQKSWVGTLPIGPWIAPASLGLDPADVRLTLTVDGETMQDSRTSEMLFSLAEIVEHIARQVPLVPGDIICTGTCAGAGMGRGRFLAPGEEVVATVEGIGELGNGVVAEADADLGAALATRA